MEDNGIAKMRVATQQAIDDMLAASERAAKDQEPKVRWLATQLVAGGEVRLTRDPLTGILTCRIIFRPAEGEEVTVFGRGYNLGAAIKEARDAAATMAKQKREEFN